MSNTRQTCGAAKRLLVFGAAAIAGAVILIAAGLLHAQAVGSWSCSLQSAPFAQGSTTYASFQCTNGAQTQVFPDIAVNLSDSAWYADEVAALISQLQNAPTTPAPGTTITPTAVTQPAPPPAYVTQFQSDYQLLLEYESAISQSLITTADLGYLAQLAKVQSEFSANETALLPYIRVK
jgi:hypothetical protein